MIGISSHYHCINDNITIYIVTICNLSVCTVLFQSLVNYFVISLWYSCRHTQNFPLYLQLESGFLRYIFFIYCNSFYNWTFGKFIFYLCLNMSFSFSHFLSLLIDCYDFFFPDFQCYLWSVIYLWHFNFFTTF